VQQQAEFEEILHYDTFYFEEILHYDTPLLNGSLNISKNRLALACAVHSHYKTPFSQILPHGKFFLRGRQNFPKISSLLRVQRKNHYAADV